MGRSRRTRVLETITVTPNREGTNSDSSLPGIRSDMTHEEVGSPQHLSRLRQYAMARYLVDGKTPMNITVKFENFCASCGHKFEQHLDENQESDRCQGEESSSCQCASYSPGGGSYTDMKGNIVVQSDVPPDGTASDRQICIMGLLRHEMCHEIHTDRDIHRRMLAEQEALRKGGEDPYYKQLYKMFNILEDGRIETIESALQPYSYRYIDGLNILHPRVHRPESDGYLLGAPRRYTVPRGYTALDAHGKPLDQIEDGIDPISGKEVSFLTVPVGTRINTWGVRPVSLPLQMQAALLAETVPGFEVGEMHPFVEEALEACRPHIEAATRAPGTEEEKDRGYGASTEECAEHARAVYEILKDRDLLFYPEEDETPRGGTEKQDADGDDEREGHGEEGNDEDSNEDGSSRGEGADGKEDGEGSGEGGSEDDENENGSEDEITSREKKKNSGAGGQVDNNGYKKDGVLPEEAKRRKELLQDLRGEVARDMDQDAAEAKQETERRRREGNIRSEDMETAHNERVLSQGELEQDIFSYNNRHEALSSEQGELRSLGRRLAQDLEIMHSHENMAMHGQIRGGLDSRRLARAVAGDPHVHITRDLPGEETAEVSILIDRSGSTSGDRDDQYRMAVMCAHAADFANIPTGIYGYSGSDGTQHYTYKEPDSNSQVGLGAIFKTGGGSTPTERGIAMQAGKLTQRGAGSQIMVVVTDGMPDNVTETKHQVEEARRRGLTVVGVGFRLSGNNVNEMKKIFGEGGWKNIKRYSEVPRIVSSLISRSLGSY